MAGDCGNRQLKRILDALRLRTHQLRHFSLSLPKRMERSMMDHRRLVIAYRERDAALAAAINRSIVTSALAAVEESWDDMQSAQQARG